MRPDWEREEHLARFMVLSRKHFCSVVKKCGTSHMVSEQWNKQKICKIENVISWVKCFRPAVDVKKKKICLSCYAVASKQKVLLLTKNQPNYDDSVLYVYIKYSIQYLSFRTEKKKYWTLTLRVWTDGK